MIREKLGRWMICAAACLGFSTFALLAQEPVPETRNQPATVRRVPPYFGQIGLTQQQREQIYQIRGKWAVRIQMLKKQLEEAAEQELLECESVLDETQKQALKLKREASAKARSRGKASASTTTLSRPGEGS